MQLVDIILEAWSASTGAEQLVQDAHARAIWALGLDENALEQEIADELAARKAAGRGPRNGEGFGSSFDACDRGLDVRDPMRS